MQYSPTQIPMSSASFQRNAALVRALTLLVALMLVTLPFFLLEWDEGSHLLGAERFLGIPDGPVDSRTRWRIAAVSLLSVGGGLYALRQLWNLFSEYRSGRVFSQAAQNALTRFAWAVFALALLLPLTRALMSVAFSIGNPPGHRYISVDFDWTDCLHILFGAVFVMIARVMAQARRLADDNAGFV